MSKWIKRGGHGALWLLAATLLTKLIGVLQKVPLQNLGGDTVFGIYNMVYPIYQLMLIFAVSGIPTAISAIIAEEDHKNHSFILRASHVLMTFIGIIFGLLMYSSASTIAAVLGSLALASMIKIIALTICVAPLLASFRGYYQGVRLASYSSISQLIEQIIRVMIMVAVLYIGVLQNWTDMSLATYVLWGGVAGAVAALVFLIVIWQKSVHKNESLSPPVKVYLHYMKLLLIRGLPAALATVIVPLIAVIDTFTVPVLLKGVASFTQMTEQFGLYSRIQPLVQLVTMLLAASIAGVLPDLVLSQSKQEIDLQHKFSLIIRFTVLIGIAATLGLILLAEPISILLYKDTEGVVWFKQLSLMTLPAAILAVITPLLLIQRRILLLACIVFVSFVSKLYLNQQFVADAGSMLGAIYATLLSLYITAVLALLAAWNKQAINDDTNPTTFKVWGKSLVALLTMTIFLFIARVVAEQVLHINMDNRVVMLGYVVALVLMGAFILIAMLSKLHILNKNEIKQLLK